MFHPPFGQRFTAALSSVLLMAMVLPLLVFPGTAFAKPAAQTPTLTTDCAHLITPWVALYQYANFQGRELCFEGTGLINLVDYGFNGQTRSINIAATGSFFALPDGAGDQLPFYYSEQQADLGSWDNQISSFIVSDGSSSGSSPTNDSRLQWATDWATQQIGSTNWGTGTNTYCEQFVENAYGVTGKAGNPVDLFNNYGGVAASPSIPGEILVFQANLSNGGNGHAAIYMGGDRMISAQADGVQWNSVSNWNSNVAPLLGFVYPPSNWPGINGTGAVISGNPSGGYCAN